MHFLANENIPLKSIYIIRNEGIVYFRFAPKTPEETAQYLLNLIKIEGLSLKNMFTKVEKDRIRQRPL